ncbi:MAG TPA: hypothetical protein VGI63_09305 [Verrucomicrobiae bacterium]
MQEKSGVGRITLSPSGKPSDTHFKVLDSALVLGFLTAFVGLVFLLAR